MHSNTFGKRKRLTYEACQLLPLRYYSNAQFYKQVVRDPRVSDRCFRCDHRRQRRRFLGSLYSWQSRPTLCLCYERQRSTTHPHPAQESFWTQQVVASLQGVGGHSPVLLTRRSMFSARPQTSVQSRAYWIFLLFFRRAFCALKYAIGTTGFTVILRATGRFMPFLTRSSL